MRWLAQAGQGCGRQRQRTPWTIDRSVLDYAGTGDAAFAWNEYERVSLEAAGEDADERDRTRRFWDEHLTVFMSVRDGYEYAAIRVIDSEIGTIVQGREPEFEDAIIVANDIASFVSSLLRA